MASVGQYNEYFFHLLSKRKMLLSKPDDLLSK